MTCIAFYIQYGLFLSILYVNGSTFLEDEYLTNSFLDKGMAIVTFQTLGTQSALSKFDLGYSYICRFSPLWPSGEA